MAKKEAVKKEEPKAAVEPQASEPVAPEPTFDAPKPSTKGRPAGIVKGEIVFFYREENTQTGSKLESHAAIILGEANAASNFKPEDGAVDLKVVTRHGDEVKNGIMFSAEPKAGYWSHRTKA